MARKRPLWLVRLGVAVTSWAAVVTVAQTVLGPDLARAADEVELLTRGFDAFFDAVLEPDVQRIIILDAPAILGLARFTELDERYAFAAITAALSAATAAGRLRVDDPETLARLLLGALTRGGMLIANSPTPRETRNAVAHSIRVLLEGLA